MPHTHRLIRKHNQKHNHKQSQTITNTIEITPKHTPKQKHRVLLVRLTPLPAAEPDHLEASLTTLYSTVGKPESGMIDVLGLGLSTQLQRQVGIQIAMLIILPLTG